MVKKTYTRRDALAATGGFIATCSVLNPISRAHAMLMPNEVILADEPTRGYYGSYDLDNFGPAPQRKVGKEFEFPKDVDATSAYGIDISHHTREIPWNALGSSKVNYIYMKASQSCNGRDSRFVEFWTSAKRYRLPCGAYHFLTAGVAGHDQALYLLARLDEVGGLKTGDLQPCIDLEWDEYGPSFTRIASGRTPTGTIVYEDYWKNIRPAEIVKTINDFIGAFRSAPGMAAVKPVIYTVRSWWEKYIPDGTVFEDCSIWIADYRLASYVSGSPRSVQGHRYYLWQFTDKALINAGGKIYGPFDSNKLLFGGIDHLKIP